VSRKRTSQPDLNRWGDKRGAPRRSRFVTPRFRLAFGGLRLVFRKRLEVGRERGLGLTATIAPSACHQASCRRWQAGLHPYHLDRRKCETRTVSDFDSLPTGSMLHTFAREGFQVRLRATEDSPERDDMDAKVLAAGGDWVPVVTPQSKGLRPGRRVAKPQAVQSVYYIPTAGFRQPLTRIFVESFVYRRVSTTSGAVCGWPAGLAVQMSSGC
jgi:hypothetical protein